MIAGIDTLKAGMDVELPVPYGYTPELVTAVQNGELDEAYINRAVYRVLTIRKSNKENYNFKKAQLYI